MNKKGDFTGLLYLIVSIAALAFFVIIVGYIGVQINTGMKTAIGSDHPEVNASFDASIRVSEKILPAVWYIVFAGLLLSLLVTAWYMPTHPIFVPIFIILLIVAIIVGVAMQNAYEQLYAVPALADIATEQGSISFMMTNLPYVALIIGLIALIVTFAKPKGENSPVM